jgi:hypothetical protein
VRCLIHEPFRVQMHQGDLTLGVRERPCRLGPWTDHIRIRLRPYRHREGKERRPRTGRFCSALSDCYGQIAAAVVVAVLLALLIVLCIEIASAGAVAAAAEAVAAEATAAEAAAADATAADAAAGQATTRRNRCG